MVYYLPLKPDPHQPHHTNLHSRFCQCCGEQVGYCLTVWLRDKCGGGYIHRSPGRIVEALVEDFMALAGSGMLTVTVQNTGTITADYSVSKSVHGG